MFHAFGNNPIKYVDPDGRKNIYFIYTFGSNDNGMLAGEFWSQLGNFADTVLSGVSIRVIIHGTRTDIINAIQDPECYALITSGHGNDEGKICTSEDGVYFTQKDIDKSKLSKNLQLVIFENCYQGSFEKEWEKAFGGGVDVVGWEGTTNTIETISFNTIGIFDRQKKNMNDYLSNIVDCIWMDRFKNFCNNLFGRNKEQNTNE